MKSPKPDSDARREFAQGTSHWRQFSYFLLAAIAYPALALSSEGTILPAVRWAVSEISVAGAVLYFCRVIKP